jgi:hypothetical protein
MVVHRNIEERMVRCGVKTEKHMRDSSRIPHAYATLHDDRATAANEDL